MSVILAIVLDGNFENVCFAGQVTQGHIIVKNSEKIKIRGIRLEVCGKGRVRWTEGSGNFRTKYIGEECYLDFAIDLVGSRNRDSEMYLEPGSRKLAFQFVFPGHVPSSYEDNIGRINYKMKAVIDRPWNIDDTAEIVLTVFRLLDLNKEPPSLWEPIVIEREKEARNCCFCCCVCGVVNIKVTISRGCFVATEEILVSGEIANLSDSSVSCTRISFVQKMEYHITDTFGDIHRTTNSEILAEIKRPIRISKGCTDSWSGIGFVVPRLPASRMDGCKFIDISYGIEISASIGIGDAWIFIPIVIGHIALNGDFQPHAVTSQPSVQMSPMASCQSTFDYSFPEDSCTRATNNTHLNSSMHATIHKISNIIPPGAFMMQNYTRLE